MSDHAAVSLFDATADSPPCASADQALLPAPADWPHPPDSAAYHGLPGQIVAAIAPHTEADPVAILGQLLVAFGAAAGRGAWFQIEATRHHPNEFLVLVGDSSKSRKGSSWDHVASVACRADPTLGARILTGLSSGEGLDLGSPRPRRRRPRPARPAAADRRARVRVGAQADQPRHQHALTGPSLRPGTDGRCSCSRAPRRRARAPRTSP